MLHRTACRLAAPAAVAMASIGLAAACESAPPSPQNDAGRSAAAPAQEAAPLPLDRFSAARAQQDLEALVAPQRDDDAAPRDVLAPVRQTLREIGVAFEEVPLRSPPPVEGTGDPWTDAAPGGASPANDAPALVATLPGASPMLFVLLASYPDPALEAVEASASPREASGAALLLEMTRVLSTRPLPYTTRAVWLPTGSRGAGGDAPEAGREGEGAAGGEAGAAAPAAGDAEADPARQLASALASRMQEDGALARVRLLVVVDSACAPDLEIARDLGSHRMHRETFFRAAQRLGRTRTFPAAAEFETVSGPHLAFRDRGVRPVVALSPSRLDEAGDAEGAAACASESLESVGVVLLEGLDVIGQRLAKIDRFSRSPLVVDLEEEAVGAPVSASSPPRETGTDADPPEAGDAADRGSTPAPSTGPVAP